MPIKNYTTKVSAKRSIDQIQDALIKHGAVGFQMMFEQGTGKIESLRFLLPMGDKTIPFALPVNWRKFQQVLKNDKVSRWKNDDYVYRVTWRCLRDWVLAQLALYETQVVEIQQIFLPFATDTQGETVYQKFLNNQNLLSEPN